MSSRADQSVRSSVIGSRLAGGTVLGDVLAIALLWLLILAFYWRIAIAGRVLAEGDLFTYFYPYWAEATRALRAGRLPLWNPYLFMGVPFLANSQAGVLYPLNWPLWFTLPAHVSVHASILLHVFLAGLGAYLWTRQSLRLRRGSGWVAGVTYALGGYLVSQVEHINQLQGLAWLPFALMLVHRAIVVPPASRRRWASAVVALAVVLALILLAGHTQTAFISMVAIITYSLGPPLWRSVAKLVGQNRASSGDAPTIRGGESIVGLVLRRMGLLVLVLVLGIALAGIQLVPTFELARYSIRAGGLPFKERVSFSLSPFYLTRALLPGYGAAVQPAHIEHVAYIGLAGLVCAAVALVVRGRPATRFLDSDWEGSPTTVDQAETGNALRGTLLLVALGLLLALGGYNPLYLPLARFVPGFAHFRVPARWLGLYGLGVAGLAGMGVQLIWEGMGIRSRRARWTLAAAFVLMAAWGVEGVRLGEGGVVGWLTIAMWAGVGAAVVALLALADRAPRATAVGLVGLLLAELALAGLTLPHARATAPQAFTSLRPAIAHLRAGTPGRFLSLSDLTFDPGDLAEIEVAYGPQLPQDALYDYIVAVKLKEVLSPNLSLAFAAPAVDGYDGGVLPLASYVAWQRLLLLEDAPSLDGRLRENLSKVPDGRWLNLFNVRYIVTDKLRDAWLDDVFYDLQFGARLAHGQSAAVAHVPSFETTALGVVSYLAGGVQLTDGLPVGKAVVSFADGTVRTFELRAGEHTAEGLYGPGVAHNQAPIGGHFWPGQPQGNDYVARLRWDEPAVPVGVRVEAVLPEGQFVVRGLSLIDERTGSFQSLVVSDQGQLQLAHSGDVKIYENLDVLPRALFVHHATTVPDDETALVAMHSPHFDPANEVVLEGAPAATRTGAVDDTSAVVHIISDAPESVVVEVDSTGPGYLILTDAWYPGWEARVDGRSVPIIRADLLLRAVTLDGGHQRVTFHFRPVSLYLGLGLSLVGLLGLVICWVVLGVVQSRARCYN